MSTLLGELTDIETKTSGSLSASCRTCAAPCKFGIASETRRAGLSSYRPASIRYQSASCCSTNAGRVSRINDAAGRLLGKEQGLYIQDRELKMPRHADNRRLREMIASALISAHAIKSCGGAFVLKGTTSTGPSTVVVAPLTSSIRHEESLGAMVLVTTPRCQVPASALSMLRSVYQLTHA
ncbi:MAG: hypothetical protein LJE91_11520, partial [Gammaproteobacteria bacterium]|nr:hypothetical protein [Gammaproteobacteria bacterium]